MSATNYLENKLLDHLTNNASYTPPGLWVGLGALELSADLENGLYNSEYDNTYAPGYTRMPITFNAAVDGVAISNPVTFPVATGVWPAAPHYHIFDSATAGNSLIVQTVTGAKSVAIGDQYVLTVYQTMA